MSGAKKTATNNQWTSKTTSDESKNKTDKDKKSATNNQWTSMQQD